MPRKKGHRSVRESTAPYDQGASCIGMVTSPTIVNISSSTNVQIGSSNVLLSQGPPGDALSKTKDQAGLLLTKNVFRYKSNMSFDELQVSVKENLDVLEGKPTFFKYTGKPLEEFLIYHRDDFNIKKRKGQKIVYLKHKPDKVKESGIEKSNQTAPNYADTYTQCQPPDKEHSSATMSSTAYQDQINSKKAHEEWIKVKRKKNSNKKTTDAVPEDDDRKCPRNEFSHPFYDRFLQIITNSESKSTKTIFVASHDIYKDNKLSCCLDIVSLWNTPYLTASYILIGATQDDEGHILLDGSSERSDDEQFYGTLFDSDIIFDGKPPYNYHKLIYESKLFGIIEILSSHGQCKPIFVAQAASCKNINVRVAQLWSMPKDRQIPLSPADYSPVYMWFLGKRQNSTSQSLKEDKEPIEHSVDDTEDCQGNLEKDETSHGGGFSQLWEKSNGFKSGYYILLVGDTPKDVKNLRNLALVPWVAVYDFDIQSTQCGAFNVMQDQIGKTRHLRIGTWQDSVPEITEGSTWWCFMRGRSELHESRTDLSVRKEHGGHIETTHKWFRTVKPCIPDNGEALALFSEDYAPLTFVLLCPMSEDILALMVKYLEGLTDCLSYRPQVIVCIHQNIISEKGKNRMQTLYDDFHETLYVSRLNFESLCQGLANNIGKAKDKCQLYSLPKEDDYEMEPIKTNDANWLSEDIEVLYLNNTHPEQDVETVDRELTNFYKGGTLHWPLWYLKGEGSVEIDRDLVQCLENIISKHLKHYRTSVITLYHNPGSGGSTLAKQVLWKFHRRVPCVHAKAQSKSHSQELSKKISFIQRRTQLPVLVLIDGEDEAKVKYLKTALKYAVILYVKRYPYSIKKEEESGNVFLKGFVSHIEAAKLAEKFGSRCEEKRQKALRKLSLDVQQNKDHNLYEFGMTSFFHEFKGTASYVEGYLQLRDNPTMALLPWQRCLGYLSLVYYYGQSSMPCQFFSRLFGKPAQYAMSPDEDFPYPMTEFIVVDSDEMRKNHIRICHYLIAKEILEQILTRQRNVEEQCSDSLSLTARRNLASFCKEFIVYASSKKTKNQSAMARYILTRTFIFRDARDMGENEEQVRKRPVLSKVIVDIPAGQPLFTERLRVLEKLSESFPNDPNFLAHVGRFYAFCRPSEEEKAQEYFKKALQLCKMQNRGKFDDQLSDSMKATLMHIYHMYGIVKHRQIKKRISQFNRSSGSNQSPIDTIQNMVDIAESACDHFKKSRDITPETKEAYTYAYTGEIEVRILICDFIKKQFFAGGERRGFSQFFSSKVDEDCKLFVANSRRAIDVLIMECYKDVELNSDDLHSLRRLVQWYNELFRSETFSGIQELGLDAIGEKRIQIIEKKGPGYKTSLRGIEHIQDRATITEIVSLYEQIFKEVAMSGLVGGKKSCKDLDHDYREWILAIRHEQLENTYLIEDVLTHVQTWYNSTRSTHSAFYVFILKSLLGFGLDGNPGKTECLIDAKEMQEEMTKMMGILLHPKYPREWLGTGEKGISVLIPGNKYVGMGLEEREIGKMERAVCKGTILSPNKNPVGGYIGYHVGVATVKVFYIPKRALLEGPRYANERVEFNLAFSVERGYEAFNVRLLKRYGCSECGRNLEFRSVDDQVQCLCGELIYKDAFAEVCYSSSSS